MRKTRWPVRTAQMDFRLMNVGTDPTCIRPQGISVVYLTWATPGVACHIRNWRIEADCETLSDQQSICFEVASSESAKVNTLGRRKYPRWKYEKMDRELFNEALEWRCTARPLTHENKWTQGPEIIARELQKWVKEACDLSTPRQCPVGRKRSMHWWDEEMANAKKESIAFRRRWSRAEKHLCRNDSTEIREEVELLEMQYREAKKKLRNKIKAAKNLERAD